MKSKTLISLSLALVMLFTLATPALAGPPHRETLLAVGEPTAPTQKSAAQATHNNTVKVTIVLKGATENQLYYVYVKHVFNSTYHEAGSFQTDGKGNARYRGFTTDTFSSGDRTLQLFVEDSQAPPTSTRFQTSGFELTFK
ncbi:hypothetical protein ACFLTP_09050 [Chloroflexota bacterium]